MTECIHEYYLLNGIVCKTDSFELNFINEGSSIYEVTRLAHSGVMFLDDHIDRFFNSLNLEGVSLKFSREDIHLQIEELIRLNPAGEGNIKFVHNTSPVQEQNFLVYFTIHRYPSGEDYRKGVGVITYPFERIDPNKKIWRPVFRSDVTNLIRKHSAWEALLVDPRGFMPEASRSNLFAIREGVVITSPDKYILTGITRKHVLQACRELEIPVEYRLINIEEIGNMDAMFLTSTSLQLIGISHVDAKKIPLDGSIVQHIRDRFDLIKKNHFRKTKNTA